jgi:hypothetical protein
LQENTGTQNRSRRALAMPSLETRGVRFVDEFIRISWYSDRMTGNTLSAFLALVAKQLKMQDL